VPPNDLTIRPARASDVRAIRELCEPFVAERFLVAKPPVAYYESVQEFQVALVAERLVGCGAVHVMWDGLGEIRTLAVDQSYQGQGVGRQLMEVLVARARALDLNRLFCLTFETAFFGALGFTPIQGVQVTAEVYAELLQSHDDGIAEFLDIARVKPNTLGNTRMILHL